MQPLKPTSGSLPAPVACPDCGRDVGGFTGPSGQGLRPSPGDVSVCVYCGAVLRFTDSLALRLATPWELGQLPGDVRARLAAMRVTVSMFDHKKGGGR